MGETGERPTVTRDDTPPLDRVAQRDRSLARARARRITKGRRNEALVLAYTALGHTAQQVADELGLAKSTVHDIRYRLRCAGKLDNVVALMEKRAVPAAVEGLIEAIDAGEEWAITKTLQGRGYLASGAGANGANLQQGPPPALTVNVMLAPGVPANDPRLKAIPGNIVGVPRPAGALVEASADTVADEKA